MKSWLKSVLLFIKPGLFFYCFSLLFFVFYVVESYLFDFNFEGVVKYVSTLSSYLLIPLFFLTAFAETIFVLGYYFPGSFVLLACFVVFHTTPLALTLYVSIWSGVVVGCALNYLLGYYFSFIVDKFGHKNLVAKSKNIVERFGHWAFGLLSVHPNYCGTSFLALGLMRVSFSRSFFVTIMSLTLWLHLWVLFFEHSGVTASNVDGHAPYVVVVTFIVGLLVSCYRWYKVQAKV